MVGVVLCGWDGMLCIARLQDCMPQPQACCCCPVVRVSLGGHGPSCTLGARLLRGAVQVRFIIKDAVRRQLDNDNIVLLSNLGAIRTE